MRYPGFIHASYQSQAVTADQERLVNMYVERMESPGATSKAALYPVPGVSSVGTALASPGRAHFAQAGREFAVIGSALVEIAEDGTVTSRGTVAADSNPATITSNGDGGDQLFITSGTNGYCYNLSTNTLTQVVALDGKATMCDFLDGYFLVLDASTSTLYISALLDGTSWTTGTDFAQRTKAPDPWKSMKVSGIYIGLFGEHTSEFWYDSGAASFPFAPHPSGLIPFGIAAAFSPSVGEGSIFWLGQSRIGQRAVYRASGFTPEVVSDFPRQLAFDQYDMVSDAQGDIINWRGHTFYLLTFPDADITWAYDLSTNLWFEWRTWIQEENDYAAWRPRWHAMAFGEHRMLDSETGSIYRLDATVSQDVDSRVLRWLRRAPALTAENELIFYQAFELDLEPGLGTSGQGEDPQVMMRMSGDGGKTWGSEMWRSAGKQGEYGRRVRWERLGAARRRVFEVAGSDPVPYRLTDAFLTLGQPVRALAGAR